jgi:hypothetical protein
LYRSEVDDNSFMLVSSVDRSSKEGDEVGGRGMRLSRTEQVRHGWRTQGQEGLAGNPAN